MERGEAGDGDLRVLMAVRRLPVHGHGGLQRHVHQLTVELARRGIAVDLVSESPERPSRAAEAAAGYPEGVTVHWIPGRWLPLGKRSGTVVLDRITNYPAWSLRVGRWMIGAGGADPRRWSAVHVHGLAGWGLARRLRRLGRPTPLILSAHGMEEFQVSPGPTRWAYAPFRRAIRTIAAVSDRVVALDEHLAPLVGRHLGVEEGRRVVIPAAVDPEACRAAGDVARGRRILGELGLTDPAPLFLSVGRLAPNKGFEVLTAALEKAAPELSSRWAWVLVGDGPSRRSLEARLRASSIASRCRLAGAVPEEDLHALYAVADWFVHPTLYEGSSIVTLEAMAHGLPVIATRAGGLPDKVVDGRTGFLVEPGDRDSLADALLRVDDADAGSMGRRGAELCETGFSWNVVATRYLELYRSLVR